MLAPQHIRSLERARSLEWMLGMSQAITSTSEAADPTSARRRRCIGKRWRDGGIDDHVGSRSAEVTSLPLPVGNVGSRAPFSGLGNDF
jgi:hypothetical protein